MPATVFISYEGKSYGVHVDLTNTVESSSQAQLEELMPVSVGSRKLMFKGKKASAEGDATLEAFGL